MTRLPWLPYLAIDYLNHWLKPEMSVFEWGAGGSTFWLAERVANVTTIEHSLDYRFDSLPENVVLYYIQPDDGELGNDPANPSHYRSRPIGGVNFKNYASIIDTFEPFDLILVDGRARAACLYHALPKVKRGGFVVIDNTERDYYLAQVGRLYEGRSKIVFYGHGPQNTWKWETTFFKDE